MKLSTRSVLVLLGLAACTDRPVPGEPQFGAWPEIRGVMTDGVEAPLAVEAYGSTGIKRVIAPRDSLGHYVLAISELGLPYVVEGHMPSGLYNVTALAFDTGTVNVTPFTTLAMSQALSEDDLADVDEAKLLEAQARMATFLSDSFGIIAPSPATDWAKIEFNPVAGDPTYEALGALTAAIEGTGSSVATIIATLAQQGSLCRQEKLSVGGVPTGAFCPATRVSLPDEDDPSKVRYTFIAQNFDSLVVETEAGAVTASQFYRTDGNTFTCTACTGIAVGAMGVAGERSLAFTNVSLQGTSTLTLAGTITGPPPGITLPPLYCTDRKFVLIKPDRTAVARCFDQFPGGAGFTGSRIAWGGYGDSWSFDLQTTPDGQVISMVYMEMDENFQQLPRFACELDGCSGISVGPLVNDVDWGATRRLTFHDVRLAEVQPDSTLSSTSFAVLNYSAVMFSLDGQSPPDPPVCDNRPDSLAVTGTNGAPHFTFCPPANDTANFQYTRQSFVQDDGEPGVFATDDNINFIQVTQEGSSIRQVIWGGGNSTGIQANCLASACVGVTVTPPDANGVQTMSFSNTVMHEMRLYGLKLQSERIITVNGTIGDIIPPPVSGAPAYAPPKPVVGPIRRKP